MDVNLQLALDFGGLDEALHLAERVRDYVDWIEAGTPLIVSEGVRAVRELKASFPHKILVADLKIIDGGGRLSKLAFGAGADVVTVLGYASDVTIAKAMEQARRCGTKILVDMLNVADLAERVQQVERLGVHYIGIHAAWDVANAGAGSHEFGAGLLQDLQAVATCANLPFAVGGGVDFCSLDAIMAYKPTTIIVGGAIASAEDPVEAARLLKQKMRAHLCFNA